MAKDKYQKEIIEPNDRASELAHKICVASCKNCPAVYVFRFQERNFRGPISFSWKEHILQMMASGKMSQIIQNDGAGGKPQFFTLIGSREIFKGLGWEIITMCADDISRFYGFPAVMVNEIQAQKLTEENFHLLEALMEGYSQALATTGLVNLTGETAVMKHSITAFCDTKSHNQLILTWSGVCVGLVRHDLLINRAEIKPGLPIIGFWEPCYRCNGGTFLTDLILLKFGPDLCSIFESAKARKFIKKLTAPSQSYAKTITRLLGWQPDGTPGQPLTEILTIAHITGGGIWQKFGEALPEGIGAYLHSMPTPAQILLEAQELSLDTPLRLSDWQAYSTFHGGCGMLLICKNKKGADLIIEEAKRDGILSQIVGETIKSNDKEIIIKSRFQLKEGENLSSKKAE